MENKLNIQIKVAQEFARASFAASSEGGKLQVESVIAGVSRMAGTYVLAGRLLFEYSCAKSAGITLREPLSLAGVLDKASAVGHWKLGFDSKPICDAYCQEALRSYFSSRHMRVVARRKSFGSRRLGKRMATQAGTTMRASGWIQATRPTVSRRSVRMPALRAN